LPGFTNRYDLTQLVYYETFYYPDAAIAREKEIKGWRRSMTRGWQTSTSLMPQIGGEIPRSA
jgi:predicted GIY-YIG superfamily endonuclease